MRTASRPPDSRTRILAAAAAEFAARGYDGTRVDRIARAARLNKAMIYYHFTNKAALYTQVFRDFIATVLARARTIAASEAEPREKIAAFVGAIVAEAQLHPHFPPMWLREIAEGGRHLDRATIKLVRQVPETLSGIVGQGRAAGVFRPCHPLLLHFSIVGPLTLYFASRPIRSRMASRGRAPLMVVPTEQLLSHVTHATLATLAPDLPERRRRS